jgi:hypothetical protein
MANVCCDRLALATWGRTTEATMLLAQATRPQPAAANEKPDRAAGPVVTRGSRPSSFSRLSNGGIASLTACLTVAVAPGGSGNRRGHWTFARSGGPKTVNPPRCTSNGWPGSDGAADSAAGADPTMTPKIAAAAKHTRFMNWDPTPENVAPRADTRS